MKKFFVLMLMASLSLTQGAHRIDPPLDNYNWVAAAGITMCGADRGCEISMEGTRGTFYKDGRLVYKLKFVSYNRSTHRLIIKAYNLRGRYAGQFSGKYTKTPDPWGGDWEYEDYYAVFKSAKGRKTNYHFMCGY